MLFRRLLEPYDVLLRAKRVKRSFNVKCGRVVTSLEYAQNSRLIHHMHVTREFSTSEDNEIRKQPIFRYNAVSPVLKISMSNLAEQKVHLLPICGPNLVSFGQQMTKIDTLKRFGPLTNVPSDQVSPRNSANLPAMAMKFVWSVENVPLIEWFKNSVERLVTSPVIDEIFNPNPNPNIFTAFYTIDLLAFEQWS